METLQKSLVVFDQFESDTKIGGVIDAATLDKYLETRLEEVMNMIKPALPVPQTVRILPKRFLGLQKRVQLEYVCSVTGDAVTVTSSHWSQWLRASATFVKIGLCVVTGDLGGAGGELIGTGLAVVGTAMAAYSEEEAFLAQLDSEAARLEVVTKAIEKSGTSFLTSREADILIQGLRKEGFFDKMRWDSGRQQWVSVKVDN